MDTRTKFRFFVRDNHDLDSRRRKFSDRIRASFSDPYGVDALRAEEYYENIEDRLIFEYLREGTIAGRSVPKGRGAWTRAYELILDELEEYRVAAEEEADAA